MQYEQLLALCNELHNQHSQQRVNQHELQQRLNSWTQTVSLGEACDLLDACQRHGDFGTVFIYALSALQTVLVKCGAIVPVKELNLVKERLIRLLNSGHLNGFTIIKVAKLIAIILFNQLWAVDDAIAATIVSITSDDIKLDVIRIFIEDFQSAKSLGLEHQQHIYTCLYHSAPFVIAPLLAALRQLSAQHQSRSISAIKLLGSLISVYSLDLDQLPQCIELCLEFITQPKPETIELVAACVESITEVVTINQYQGRSKDAMIYLVTGQYGDFRRNEHVRRVYSHVLSAMFAMVAQIVNAEGVLNDSFLSWGQHEFMPRLIHFCRSFMANHFGDYNTLKRANASNMSNFSGIELLDVFFKLTFCQRHHDAIESCLDIWDDFLDQLQVIYESKMSSDSERNQYTQLLVSLFNESLKMIQFAQNGALLNTLDNDERDEDGETERGRFVTSHIEVIAKICVLHPDDIINALLPQLKSQAQAAMTQTTPEPGKRDLGTLIQLTGRLIEHFLGERFLKMNEKAAEVLDCLLLLSECVLKGSNKTEADIELLSQCVSCMRPLQHWLSQLYSYCQTEAHSQQDIVSWSNRLIALALSLLSAHHNHPILAKIAAQLVQCWAAVVRPAFADKIDAIGDFVKLIEGGTSMAQYGDETAKLLLLAGASLFVLPYPNTPLQEQKWPERREHFAKLTAQHSANLPFLTATCQLVYSESAQCRDCAAHGLRPIALTCINERLIEDEQALRFINEYFTNLRQQAIGDKELCTRTVHACSSGMTPAFIATALSSEKAVAKMTDLVAILTAIIEYTKDKELLSMIIKFVLDTLVPASHNQLPVLHASLLTFLATLIGSRWRTFFPGNVLSTIMKSSSTTPPKPAINHLDVITKIIDSFTLGIKSTDLTLAKCATEQLLLLHKERKFFDQSAVRLHFGGVISRTIIDVLLQGHHGIMIDELLTLFYCTTANNQHISLITLLNEKFADLLPANVLKQVTLDSNLDFPTFRLVIQKLLLESRNR